MISGINYNRCGLLFQSFTPGENPPGYRKKYKNYGSIYTSPLVLSVCVNNQLISQKIENMLCYHALNPAHVPFYVENSHTLASTYTCRIRRADIEVSNEDIIVGIISSPTCYPLSNYFF